MSRRGYSGSAVRHNSIASSQSAGRSLNGGGVIICSSYYGKYSWPDLPRLGPALAEFEHQPSLGSDERWARWDAWWEEASREPALQPAVAQRHAVFEAT